MESRGEAGKQVGATAGKTAGGYAGAAVGGYFGGPVGAEIGRMVGEKVGEKVGVKIGDKAEEKAKDTAKELEDKLKKKGGSCSGNSSSSDSSSDSSPNADPTSPQNLGDVGIEDIDTSTNQMCKKIYTVYRAIPPDPTMCPIPDRDNVSDQFTPLDDLLTMEKTTRDFLKLEGKIYDSESTNPRFFASEDWIQQYEKAKNIVLAAQDQFKANITRMQHLYTMVDSNSASMLKSIPNQNCKSEFQTNIMWTSTALNEWIDNWFIFGTNVWVTPLWDRAHWLPGQCGEMINWMKIGNAMPHTQSDAIGIETMIEKVDKLEGIIDRMMNKEAVNQTISKFIGVKETLQKKYTDQETASKSTTFTSKIIDSTQGKKLGVVETGLTNEKKDSIVSNPKPDDVEQVNLTCKLSAVKQLFKQLRTQSMCAMKSCRCVSSSGTGPFPLIWTTIDILAAKLYGDLTHLNSLIQNLRGDIETAGGHCSVTSTKICPIMLNMKIQALKTVIMKGVIDVMTNQALLPKAGLGKLDSMFNQLWELGEKGPSMTMPSWCQQAMDSVSKFEHSMIDAWDEVFCCWEREFLVRLWRIEVEHHTTNWVRQQDAPVSTTHDHTHNFVGVVAEHATASGTTEPSSGGDSMNMDTSPMQGHLICPTHLDDLMKPICKCYREDDIEPLAKSYRADVKALCKWIRDAIMAIGIKQSAISAVMSDSTLNGNCGNVPYLAMINELRDKNMTLLEKVEKAYGIFSDVNNLKNKKEYDEQVALSELQPKKYSNEDQLNMSSSVQVESKKQIDLSSEICQGGICISELKPWNHIDKQYDRSSEPKPLPSTCACNKFDKVVKTLANFESAMNLE